MKKHSGFTLVEMLIVLVVVGTLFAFSIPKFTSWYAKERARTAKIKAEQLDLYKAQFFAEKRDTATVAWNTATSDEARYQLLRPYILAAPTLLGNGLQDGCYVPRDFYFKLNTLSEPTLVYSRN